MAGTATTYDALVPHVPRLLVTWLAESPDAGLRELDGSMVFVDISGFTKMSEQLARKGKIGAEEVTDVISGVFARLLAVAYGNGGGLIKFGGDALLLFFSGEHHELRAARSAVGMRQSLRDIGPIRTSGGTVRLRMSVGLHTGPFLFFLVGGSHRELIVTGPAASETVHMESTAEAGQIVISHAAASAIPANVLGEPKGHGVLLRSIPPGLERYLGEYEHRIDGIELADCIPVALREVALAALDEPEHRQATIAFVHYDGVDSFVAKEGPEGLASALDELVRTVQQAADTNGVTFLGSDIDADGGKIILAAGVPQALGDDEERMLLTAGAISQGGTTLPVRIGVNQGHVFAGEVGPLYRRTYTVMGDAVNLAARVMAQAQTGQVLATVRVLDASAIAFRADTLDPFHVKGKTEPVVAAVVGEALGSRQPRAGLELPLVGRDEELEAIGRAVREWRAGQGGVLEIVGPAGIGKTRLLGELHLLAGDAPVLAAACDLYAATTPYRPFRLLLESLLELPPDADDRARERALTRRLARDAPELQPWVPLLGLLLDLQLPPTQEVRDIGEEFRKSRLEALTTELIARLVPEPFVLTIEDVHWLDEASCDLFGRLTAETEERPWLLCVTRRDEGTGFHVEAGPHAAVVRPQPLEAGHAELLIVSATEDSPFRPHEIGALARRGSGNPLFLLELVRAAHAAGSVEDLPASVEGMVAAEVDRLPALDRRLLRRASVLGTTFTSKLLETLYLDDEQPLDPRAFLRLGEYLVEESDGSWRFRHALMRDAAYESLPFKRRRALHSLAAEAIEQRAGESPDEEAELLSLHFFHAGRFDDAWRYARTAAERARAKYAEAEAADFYRRALRAARGLSVSDHDLAAVHEALGEACDKLGSSDEAMTAFRVARRRLRGDPIAEARLLLKEAWILERLGRYPQALRVLGRGLRALDGDDNRTRAQRAQLAIWYSTCRNRQGRHDDAVLWCARAIADAEQADDQATLGWALLRLGATYCMIGQPEASEHLRQALAIYNELGDVGKQAAAVNNLAVSAYYAGDWQEALDLYADARVLYQRCGDAIMAGAAAFNFGEVLSLQGHFAKAERLVREAQLVWRSAHAQAEAEATRELGRIAYLSGRTEEALALLENARLAFQRAGAAVEEVEIDVRVAECHLYRGEPRLALAAADEALTRATSLGIASSLFTSRLYRIRGCALLAQADDDGAQAALDKSLRLARTSQTSEETAFALAALARIATIDPDDGEALEAESSAILERLGIVRPALPPLLR